FDFEEQVRDQIEAMRVVQFMGVVPDERLGVSFDVTPAEKQAEYLRQPIEETTGVKLFRVRFPLLLDSSEEKNKQRKQAKQFMDELQTRFDEADRKARGNAGMASYNRQRAFVALASAYFPGYSDKPEELENLAKEKPEEAAEIRRTREGQVSQVLETDTHLVVIFLVSKTQSGFAPFSRPDVQNELERRLQNQRWNDFRKMVDQELIRNATVVSGEAGALGE
ncbi:MAG: hypothetical protein AB7K09_13455, partial [Planctomycetota bacterium]